MLAAVAVLAMIGLMSLCAQLAVILTIMTDEGCTHLHRPTTATKYNHVVTVCSMLGCNPALQTASVSIPTKNCAAVSQILSSNLNCEIDC